MLVARGERGVATAVFDDGDDIEVDALFDDDELINNMALSRKRVKALPDESKKATSSFVVRIIVRGWRCD